MINAIIIENNQEAKNYLHSLLEKEFTNISILATTGLVKEGINLIRSLSPELIFLDIELDDGLGFEILDAIKNRNFEVIFITGFNNYYEKAMEHFAFNYLLKPIDLVSLRKVINRYEKVKDRHFLQSKYFHFKEFIKEQSSKILLPTGSEHISVLINNIIYCKAEGNYTTFILQNKKEILVTNVLKHYCELFLYRKFFRASRSCLINISHITSIYKKEYFILSNNDKIRISVRNKSNLSALINTLT